MEKEINFNDEITAYSEEPNRNIVIQAENGKNLTLDFNGEKLKVYGDLEYDESAKLFFDALNGYFEKWKKKLI